jgi:cell division protein FtsZ
LETEMTINLTMPATISELKPRIVVFGIGGAGGNAVNNMISAELEGVEFVATNTDAQSLSQSLADRQIQLGVNLTQGLGAGSRPDVGRLAADEAKDLIVDHLQGSHMVFITAGMGGGTGTGAAPVIAQLARDSGILTVAVVTKPFHFEGAHRMAIAEQGIEELQTYVDTLIMIPNQNLFRVANEKTTFADAFKMADDVLYSGVRGVTDLMVMPGLINLDFADIRSVMMEMGKAMMGTGEASGDKRAVESAEAAISNPLLDDVSMKGARGVLINVTGGPDMTLFEVDEAANRIRDEVDPNANIIFGSTFDEALEGAMRVSVVATGIEAEGVARRPEILMRATEAMASRNLGAAKEIVGGHGAPVPEVVPFHRPAEAEGQALSMSSGTPAAVAEQGAADVTIVEAGNLAVAVAAPALAPLSQPMPQPMARPAAEPGEAAKDGAPLQPAAVPPAAAPPRPVVPPRPVGDDHFIPPAAAEAGVDRQPLGRPEPFAEAAVANAGGSERRRERSMSLLERMTGSGRSRKRAERAATIDGASAATSSEPIAEPKAPLAAPASRREPPPLAPKADLATRAMPAQPDEDLLEIPAFLRRQAN